MKESNEAYAREHFDLCLSNQNVTLTDAMGKLRISIASDINEFIKEQEPKIAELKMISNEQTLQIDELKSQLSPYINFESSSDVTSQDKNDGTNTLLRMHSNTMELAKKVQFMNAPIFHDTVMTTKVMQLEINKIFPVAQINTAGLLKEYPIIMPDGVYVLTNLKSFLEPDCVDIRETEFNLSGYQVPAHARISTIGNSAISISVNLRELKRLKIDIFPRVFVAIKNQTTSDVLKDVVRTAHKEFKSDAIDNYSVTVTSDTAMNPSYCIDDSIMLLFYAEMPWQTRYVSTYFGSLVWSIDDYSKRKQAAKDKTIFYFLSPYFYTSPKGYRVQALVYLNGSKKFVDKGLTFGISFQNGEWDDKLDLSFRHKTTVTVFNPATSKKKITKSVVKKELRKLTYFIDIGTHEKVESLLEHGVLFYQVTIDKID